MIFYFFQAVLDQPIDSKMNWDEYFILFGRTIKMKSAILYPYGPLRGNGCCRMLHVKHLAVTSAIYTLVSWHLNIYTDCGGELIFCICCELNWIETFFNYNFLIGVWLCQVVKCVLRSRESGGNNVGILNGKYTQIGQMNSVKLSNEILYTFLYGFMKSFM